MTLSRALPVVFLLGLARCTPNKHGSPDTWIMV